MTLSKRTQQRLQLIAKLALACAILGYLLIVVERNEGFSRLWQEEKNWRQLTLGVAFIFSAICLSFVRWHLLVRALGLPFRLVDAFRLGSLGFALNFIALGSIGGDVFKAVFIARGQPGRRTQAVATVALDRLVGLFAKLIIASSAVLLIDLGGETSSTVTVLSRSTLVCTVVALLGVLLVLYLPGITRRRLLDFWESVPTVGPILAALLSALGIYRQRKWQLLQALLISLVGDCFFTASFFFISSGLPMHTPTLWEHFFIVPLAAVAGGIPITPSGLGTLEAALEALYLAVPSGVGATRGDGTIVALAHRVGMIVCAGIGMVFYVTQRSALERKLQTTKETAVAAGS